MCSILQVDNVEELQLADWESFFTPESLKVALREQLKRFDGVASNYEVEIVGKLGRRRSLVVHGAPLLSAGHNPRDRRPAQIAHLTQSHP